MNYLMNLESGLTAWELDFIESLDKRTSPLTDKQADKLEDIHKRLCR